jgi:hypothetical protein
LAKSRSQRTKTGAGLDECIALGPQSRPHGAAQSFFLGTAEARSVGHGGAVLARCDASIALDRAGLAPISGFAIFPGASLALKVWSVASSLTWRTHRATWSRDETNSSEPEAGRRRIRRNS